MRSQVKGLWASFEVHLTSGHIRFPFFSQFFRQNIAQKILYYFSNELIFFTTLQRNKKTLDSDLYPNLISFKNVQPKYCVD